MPIHDLQYAATTSLRQPRLAAVACLLLAIAAFVSLLRPIYMLVPAPSFDVYIILALMILPCIASLATFVAAVSLAIADITRHIAAHISPWPRRVLPVVCLIALTFQILVAFHSVHAFLESFASAPKKVAFWSFRTPAAVASILVYLVGALYAVQIAKALRRRSLLVASLLILLPPVVMRIFWLTFPISYMGHMSHLFLNLLTILSLLLVLAPSIFFGILAICLFLAAKKTAA